MWWLSKRNVASRLGVGISAPTPHKNHSGWNVSMPGLLRKPAETGSVSVPFWFIIAWKHRRNPVDKYELFLYNKVAVKCSEIL